MIGRTCRAAAAACMSPRVCAHTHAHTRVLSHAEAPARAFSVPVKQTTGIVGLPVVPNAREVLIKLYEKTLNDIKIIPEHVPYRQDVEKVTRYRLDVVKGAPNVSDIETTIGIGQVEELIEHAKGELILIPEYASWKAWESPRPNPMDDEYTDFYETLEYVDPDSVDYLGLKQAALKKRAEAEARRRSSSAAASAAPSAAAAAAAAANVKK